jgi:FixJ family two-component response regulator
MKEGNDPGWIAIVDDEIAVCEAMEGLLRSAGLQAKSFASAEAFLRLREVYGVGCLILDIRLPGMGGLELQRHLAHLGSGIPVIFLTAQEDRNGGMQAQALQAGAVAFLHKPIAGESLLTAVHSALEIRR